MIRKHFFQPILILVSAIFVFVPSSSHAQALRDGLFDAIQFISQAVPSRVEPGQSVDVEIKIKNVGTTTWSNKARYTLVLATPQPGLSWGVERIELASDELVKPGETKTFSARITAPAVPGTYPFDWYFYRNTEQLYKDALAKTTIVVVDPLNSSEFVSQLIPDKIAPGSEPRVIVQFKNTGKTSWSGVNGYKMGLTDVAQGWGKLNVIQSEKSVPPGDVATFSFTLNAPAVAGKYLFQTQMYTDHHSFGETSPKVTISIGDLTAQGLHAAVVSQTVPKVMTAGETYEVTLVMTNMGNTVWTASDFKLAAQNPADNLIWLINRVELDPHDTIRPGQSKKFVFTIRAPDESGMYPFQWQMLSERHGYFGTPSENLSISVKPKN